MTDDGDIILRQATLNDARFIYKIFNTKEFLYYIGDKKIYDINDAKEYIKKSLIANYKTPYLGMYVVVLKNNNTAIGLCGCIDREELQGWDIGFGFLPDYFDKGYGTQSVKMILKNLEKSDITSISAITTTDNYACQKLMEKLNFSYIENITLENKMEMMLYTIKI